MSAPQIEYPAISELVPNSAAFPAEISVDVAEDVCSVLYEFVGHLGAVAVPQSYEFQLLSRAGRLARELQAAIIASVRKSQTE